MQTIQVRYQYYPGGVSTWTATSNNPPEGKSSSASGNGYTYSDAETRQAAIGNAGYFGYTAEDTIYVNGEMYQAGRQVTPTPIPMCPARTPYYEIQASRGLCVFPAEPPIPLEEEYPDAFRPPTVEPPYQPPGACTKGLKYRPSASEKIFGCEEEGYVIRWEDAPFGAVYCVCQEDSTEPFKPEGEGLSLTSFMKILPQLLLVMVAVSIIGAFRK